VNDGRLAAALDYSGTLRGGRQSTRRIHGQADDALAVAREVALGLGRWVVNYHDRSDEPHKQEGAAGGIFHFK